MKHIAVLIYLRHESTLQEAPAQSGILRGVGQAVQARRLRDELTLKLNEVICLKFYKCVLKEIVIERAESKGVRR